MKHYFKTIATAVLAVLAVAACQKENLGEVAPDGREAEVKLTLTSPQIGTKSYADGKTVNKVFVHVYQQEADGNLKYIAPATAGESATPSQVVDMTGGAAKYSTRLVTGQKYTFVFWAECLGTATSPYTYDPETKTVTVSYDGVAGNDETRDAFCNVLKDVEITGAYSSDVKLYRPFAQLNFGVTSEDYAAAKAAGLEVTAAQVKLTNAATSLNLLNGTVSGAADVTFAAAALPTETLSAAGATYKYVAMDYVLVGKGAKTLSDVTLTLTATDTQSTTPEFTYSNVPLQANYRTNIVGNLFTSPAEVQIEITPGFETPDNDVVVENVSSIAAANEAFANGATAVNVTNISSSEDTNIVLPKTTNGVSLTLPAVPAGKTVTIKYADGASEGQKPQTLTVNATSADAITIEAPTTHVELNGVTVNTVTASTSSTTLVVGKDVKITTLNIEQGAAEIYGNVSKIVKGKNAGAIFCYVNDKKDAPANVDAVCVETAEGLTAYVNNQIAFESALNRADKVVLEADMELNAGVVVSHDTELNLNKHVVSNVVDIWENSNAVVNVDNCTLSIVGTNSGQVIAKKDDCYTFNVKGNGKLIIDGGTYIGNVSVIQVEEGVAEVYGGNFSLAQTWPGSGPCGCDFMINMIDDNYKAGKAKAVVKGGTFVGFNPGDCEAEGAHTNFCAEGYASTRTILSMSSDVKEYTVKKVTEVSDASSLIKAAEDNEPYIRLMSNIEVDRTVIVSPKWSYSYVTLDLNGHKITNSKSIWNVDKGDWSILSLRSKSGCLIVKGNGIIEAKEESNDSKDAYAIDVQDKSAKVLLVDGKFVGRTHSVYSFAGDVYVEGGKYSNTNKEKYDYVINCHDGNYKDKAANIIVKGGEFANFDPGDCRAEGEHTSFLASGYKSEKDGDCYKVVKAE